MTISIISPVSTVSPDSTRSAVPTLPAMRQTPPPMSGTPQLITEEGVRTLVRDWFAVLNDGGRTEDLLRHLVSEGLVLRLPDGTLRSHDAVRAWWTADRGLPRPARVPRDVVIRITSPLHAEVTMSVACGPSPLTRESWSVVARDGVCRIRTCLVLGPVNAR